MIIVKVASYNNSVCEVTTDADENVSLTGLVEGNTSLTITADSNGKVVRGQINVSVKGNGSGIEEFEATGLEILMQTRDLHNSEYAEGNVMTEYEKNFSEKGFTINSAIVRF